MNMPKTPKSEDVIAQMVDTNGTQPANVLSVLTERLEKLSTRTPTATRSAPEKYNVGDNFQRWKKQVKICLENFLPERHPNLVLSRVWENDSPSELEKNLLEQLVLGSRSNNVRQHLLINPPSDVEMAVKRAEDTEKLMAATAANQECPTVGQDGAQEVGH
ncbi:unnamed protein product [Echinostoma caproni]|uniref:Gag_p30 domain-containing protein n=1 Tax=Echinostoma caproni TaxID=27848 RepID=A0A183A294_9TREM|nr:unnamed protein product [Echinostoma caproni]